MTAEDLVHGLRIYSTVMSAVVAILGTFQIKRWRTYLAENQLAWIALALLNLAVFVGSLQTLLEHAPGGERTYVTALATTFAFYAVAFHPARALWRRWRVRVIAQRAARECRDQAELR